jgi:hypothetical protein
LGHKAATTLAGIGSNLTLVNYDTLSNIPTNLLTSNIASNIFLTQSTATTTYQPTLTAATTLAGIGSNLTLVNYDTLSNIPLYFTPDTPPPSLFYNQTQIHNISSITLDNSSNYTLNISNLIQSNIYTKTEINNLPLLQKKKGFSFICSNVITINSVNYYKYDIDLTKYTNNLYLDSPATTNQPYRIFSIKCFISSCLFNNLTNNFPQVFQYDVYMSKPDGTTINICAIGMPENYNLNNVPPSHIFLLQTTDYNYLSVVSTVNNIGIKCIIKDNLY